MEEIYHGFSFPDGALFSLYQDGNSLTDNGSLHDWLLLAYSDIDADDFLSAHESQIQEILGRCDLVLSEDQQVAGNFFLLSQNVVSMGLQSCKATLIQGLIEIASLFYFCYLPQETSGNGA